MDNPNPVQTNSPACPEPVDGAVPVSPQNAFPEPTEPVAADSVPAHTGKIARLPRAVRDELNRRLDDGEKGEALLEWLNDQPATREAVTARFGGHPVTKQNLSEWRQGGFLDWRRQQESLAFAGLLLEQADDAAALSPGGVLTDRLAGLVALSLGQLLQSASRRPDGPDKTKAVLDASRELMRLRHSDWAADLARRDLKDWRRADQYRTRSNLRDGFPPIE